MILKKYILTTVALLILIIGAAYFYSNSGKFLSKEKTSGQAVVTNKKAEAEAKAEIKKSFEEETPAEKIPDYENMSGQKLMQEVHDMTHQKVKAEEKWGASKITKDKVLKLYDVVKNKQFSDENTKDMLLEILEPWTQGDFSNAVTAHNQIWDYQEGSIGKATRLLTPVEEEDYIKEKF